MGTYTFDTSFLLHLMSVVPVQDWVATWPADSTVVVRMTSKAMREQIDKMRLPIALRSNWHNLFDHRNGLSLQDHRSLTLRQTLLLSRLFLVTTIELIDCDVFGRAMQPLSEVLLQCRSLEHLDVSFNGIENEGLKIIAGPLAACTKLKSLNFAGNFIGNDGAARLAAVLVHFPALKHLDLSRNRLNGSGLASIAQALPLCPKLAVLKLDNNNFGGDVRSLANALPLCPALVIIDLSHTDLDTLGAVHLIKALPHSRHICIQTTGNPAIAGLQAPEQTDEFTWMPL